MASTVGLALTAGACATKVPAGPKPLPEATTGASLVAGSQTAATTAIGTAPAPTVAARPASFSSSASILCRGAWGARPPRPGGRPHTITRMTLHHAGVVLGDNRIAPARLRQHQHFHQAERGWIDIAYHVGIDLNGNIYELRTPKLAGDTATDYDPTGHFLVFCDGDFDQQPISEAQLNSAALVFAWATQTFQVASDTIAGHRDFAETTCPGANLYAHIPSGDLKRRIDDLSAAGTVNLQPVCGPEAAARVAEIEAGG